MSGPGRDASNTVHQRGRKRPRLAQSRRNRTPTQQNLENGHVYLQHSNAEPSIPSPAPPPASMSFEDKIALALSGSNWQQLQQPSIQPTSAVPEASMQVEEPAYAEDDDSGPNRLPGMTAKQRRKKKKFDSRAAQHAGDVLQTIEKETLQAVPQPVTWDSEPELLCSYNWQGSSNNTNTIFVPGEPAKWQPPALPFIVEPDSGFQYADYNYARQPRTPYEPMFQALSIMNPDYQFTDVDVLADRNNLRVLLEFVQGKANGPFRLDLYTIFNTLVIVRNETKWWGLSDGKSYGCNFEAHFTRPAQGMEDATSHYRTIRYSMGPLSVVCRFEADAYDDGAMSDDLTATETEAVKGGLAQRPSFNYRVPIRTLQKGHIVPTAQMVELKTKAIKIDERGRDICGLVQCQDQLWFGRTSLLYTGPYESGTGVVNRIKYEDATERIQNWESKNQESLQKLVGLLTQLKEIMKRERRPNRAVILVREDKGGPLSVRSMESMHHAIGKKAFDKHWRRQMPQPGLQRFRGPRGGRGYMPNPRGRSFRQIAPESDYEAPQVGDMNNMRGRGGYPPYQRGYYGRGGAPQ